MTLPLPIQANFSDWIPIGIFSEWRQVPAQLPKLFLPEWKVLLHKMVVLQPVTFRTKREFNLHKILRAIDTNVILSKLTELDYCKRSEIMIPLEELLVKFEEYPEIIANTQKLMDQCHFEFD